MRKAAHQLPWVTGFACLLLAGTSLAGAPQQHTQAPGFYRAMLGDFELTVLSDGTLPFDVSKLLTNITPAQLDADLSRAFLHEPVEFSVNAFLINTGARLVLIDTGTGTSFGPGVGRLLQNLKAAGYAPEQIDEIYITHMHGDHIGGLTQAGKAVFANALVRASQNEADYWLSEKTMSSLPEGNRGGLRAAQAALKPYVDSGRFRPFSGDAELAPGIRGLAAFGHTPGHAVYLVSSRNEHLLVWGDLMHVAAVQFPDPQTTITFDSDSPAAARTRLKFLAEAAREGWLVGGAHLPFPGLGHVRSADAAHCGCGSAMAAHESYVYLPLAYQVPH